MTPRYLLPAALMLAGSSLLSAQARQTCPAVTGATMPLTYKGGATVPDITPCDLMTRLYIYAADSMRGREAGSPDAIRATAYIEREVRRLGLKPGGDNGTYYQYLPVTAREVSNASTITAGGRTFHPNKDFTANAAADTRVSGNVIFGGTIGDSSSMPSADAVKGKIVVVRAGAAGGFGRGGFGRGNNPFAGAEAIVIESPTANLPRARGG